MKDGGSLHPSSIILHSVPRSEFSIFNFSTTVAVRNLMKEETLTRIDDLRPRLLSVRSYL
jgi:hypothetical protein